MYSDRDIRNALDSGLIGVDPLDLELLQPSSLDVRLDHTFLVYDHQAEAIDPAQEQKMREVRVPQFRPFVLLPGEFALASTYECLSLRGNVAARLEGKSSLGRLGLLTHATAGFIDPGFSGNVTLELANLTRHPLKLWPGMKIGQLCFFDLDSPPSALYGEGRFGSHYNGQRGPTASRSYQGFLPTDVYKER